MGDITLINSNKKLKAKKPKREKRTCIEVTEQDIKEIVRLGKEKYTLKEIVEMTQLPKAEVSKILDEHKIVPPKKPNNIQRLYEQGKLDSDQFYIEATSLIKSRLMPDLIYKGYFKDGKRQASYNIEDVNDCYTYVLEKIKEKYDPAKGTLATFIRTWTRGYGTTVTTAQHRRYKRVGNDSSLDENYNNSIKDEFKDSFNIVDLENKLDSKEYSDIRLNKATEAEFSNMKQRFFDTMLKGRSV